MRLVQKHYKKKMEFSKIDLNLKFSDDLYLKLVVSKQKKIGPKRKEWPNDERLT